MNRSLRLTLFLTLAITACITSCTKLNWDEINNQEYNTSLGIPLGKVEATFMNLLSNVNDSIIVGDSLTRECYIFWKEKNNIINFDIANFTMGGNLNEIISIKDELPNGEALLMGGSITIPAGEKISFSTSYDYDFVFNEFSSEVITRVDSMLVGSSVLNCQYSLENINISDNTPLKMIISFPDITYLENYTIERIISNSIGSFNETLENYLLHFNNDETKTPIRIDFEIVSDGNLTIYPNSTIQLSSQFRLIQSQIAWGYFDHAKYVSRDLIQQVLPENFFDNPNITNNKLLFADPKINLNIHSNVGIPLIFNFDSIYVITTNNERIYADFDGSTKFTMPIDKPSTTYGTDIHTFTFDKEYGKTNRLFEAIPKEIIYQWEVATQQYKSDDDKIHYLVEPIELTMDVEVKIPLQLNPTSFFTYSDTIEANLSDLIGSTDSMENINIEVLKLYLKHVNIMPLKTTVTPHFLDENSNIIDFDCQIEIASAKVDSEGAAIEENIGESVIEIKSEDIDKIMKTNKIALYINFYGYDENSMIKITMDDKLSLHLSVFAKGGIKLNNSTTE